MGPGQNADLAGDGTDLLGVAAVGADAALQDAAAELVDDHCLKGLLGFLGVGSLIESAQDLPFEQRQVVVTLALLLAGEDDAFQASVQQPHDLLLHL